MSREQVVEAALAISREQGLEAVSLRNVARRLGIRETSLYTYVSSKDDLLRGMLEVVFTHELPLPPADDPPAEQLKTIVRELRRRAVDHVELVGLLGRLPATAAGPLDVLERILGLLAQLGLDPAQQALAYALLHHLIVASALVDGNRRRANSAAAQPAGHAVPYLDEPHRYPRIADMIAVASVQFAQGDSFDHLLGFLVDEALPAVAG